jgi:hypothetical protein
MSSKRLPGWSVSVLLLIAIPIASAVVPWIVALLGGHDPSGRGVHGWDIVILFAPAAGLASVIAGAAMVGPRRAAGMTFFALLAAAYTAVAAVYTSKGPTSELDYFSRSFQNLEDAKVLLLFLLPWSAVGGAVALVCRKRL